MHLTRNVAKTTVIISVLLMTLLIMMTNEIVQAQTTYTNMREGGSVPLPAGVTPDVTTHTVAYLSFRANPIGVGQTFLVNLWITRWLPVSRYMSDYKVTITKSDGTTDVITIDSYRADATAWFEYVADKVGTWTLKFDFAGGYFPAGNYTQYPGAFAGAGVVSFTQSCYYKPSSPKEQTLTVQEP